MGRNSCPFCLHVHPLTLSRLSDVIVDSVRRTCPAVAQGHPHSALWGSPSLASFLLHHQAGRGCPVRETQSVQVCQWQVSRSVSLFSYEVLGSLLWSHLHHLPLQMIAHFHLLDLCRYRNCFKTRGRKRGVGIPRPQLLFMISCRGLRDFSMMLTALSNRANILHLQSTFPHNLYVFHKILWGK